MIIILASCSLVIFVFTIGAKFLGRDTFDKLPDFLKDSYKALWSAGVVAGGALVGSVADALSRRESTKENFLFYIMGTTLAIMILIVGTIELTKTTEPPQFSVPVGAKAIDIRENTSKPVDFFLQYRGFGGNPVRILGSYEVKAGTLFGNVSGSELDPMVTAAPANVHLSAISIHVCYLANRNGMPTFAQSPELPTSSNREAISTAANISVPYKIPDFKFSIDVAHIDNIGPPYICGYIDGEPNARLFLF
jgi:hypothetical protein